MVRHHQEWAPSQKPLLAPVNLSCPRLPRCLEGTRITEWKIPRAPANPVLLQPLCAQQLSCLRVGGGGAVFGPAGAWQPHGLWNKGEGKQLLAGMWPSSATSLSLLDRENTLQSPTWLHICPCFGMPGANQSMSHWGSAVCFGPPSSPFTPHFWPWFLRFQGCNSLARQPHGAVLSPKRCSPDPTAKSSSAMRGPASQK